MLVRNDIVYSKEIDRYLVQGTSFSIDLPSFVVRLSITFCLLPCVSIRLHVLGIKAIAFNFLCFKRDNVMEGSVLPIVSGYFELPPCYIFPIRSEHIACGHC